MLLPLVPTQFRKRRSKPPRRTPTPPPAVALNLIEAWFDDGEVFVGLRFDRDINIGGIDLSAIQVADGLVTGNLFEGDDAELLEANAVKVALHVIGSASGATVRLSATSENGIVAVDDGGTWAGVSELELPFG